MGATPLPPVLLTNDGGGWRHIQLFTCWQAHLAPVDNFTFIVTHMALVKLKGSIIHRFLSKMVTLTPRNTVNKDTFISGLLVIA